MGKIYVEAKGRTIGPDTEVHHTYLVYENDNGDESVIRGGATYDIPGLWGDIMVEEGEAINDSKDKREDSDGNPVTPEERGQVEVDLHGRDADTVWREMVETAKQINEAKIPYDIDDNNSNSTIRTILERADVTPTLPSNTFESGVDGGVIDEITSGGAVGWDDILPLPPKTEIDLDGDGVTNSEDDDIDGDGIPNGIDPTPDYDFNDIDGDGVANAEDEDRDGDGIPNGIDSQPDVTYGEGQNLPETPPPEAPPVPEVPPRDPLSLDLNQDGDIGTVGIDAGAFFDLDNNGFAESTSWIGADDGFVVLDRNGDGAITNGGELFGTETLLSNGEFASNGFEALAELDSNGDGVIDANDEQFSELRVWRDANTDGISTADELITLDEAGVVSIDLAYTEDAFTDDNGVLHQEVGSYTRRSEGGAPPLVKEAITTVAPVGQDNDFIAASQIVINADAADNVIDISGLNGQPWLSQAYLNGGMGDDTLQGADSRDMLVGGAGNDQLSGNGGSDVYRFGVGAGQDVIVNNRLCAVAA